MSKHPAVARVVREDQGVPLPVAPGGPPPAAAATGAPTNLSSAAASGTSSAAAAVDDDGFPRPTFRPSSLGGGRGHPRAPMGRPPLRDPRGKSRAAAGPDELQPTKGSLQTPALGLPPLGGGSRPARSRAARESTPTSWDLYFDSKRDLSVGSQGHVFRVYEKGSEGPVLLLLHGGGHSALSWAVFAAAMARRCRCRLIAYDARGHGGTQTTDDADLSTDTMCNDAVEVVEALFGADRPSILLMGHSMGGAIAVHIASRELLGPCLIGLVVIDVVEGTAMEALAAMGRFLRSRPTSFDSLESAIKWSLNTGQLRSREAARVSMPPQLKPIEVSATTAAASNVSELAEEEPGETEESAEQAEAGSGSGSDASAAVAKTVTRYTWRIDLSATEPFWVGWFKGLSKLFLESRVLKLLVLAGTDRLDTDLTIGQMQGKFQLVLLSGTGHSVHEDAPDKVAEAITGFLLRNRLADPA